MKLLQSAAFVDATFATTTFAALQTFSPLSGSGPSYSVGIPSSSSISASSNGDLYIQMRAPQAYTWVAFGIGEGMSGARIFIMYADGKGNVTVSARKSTGHVQPRQDGTLQKGLVLLGGSGVEGGQMTANFKVSSTTLESDKQAKDSNFIAAWAAGTPLASTSLTETIRQHSDDAYRQITLDLSKAVLTSTVNPFTSAAPVTSTPNSDAGGGAKVVGTDGTTLGNYQKAHGIVMSVAVVLLFPLGAVFIRLGGSMLGHVTVQMLALLSMIVGFGLGIKLGNITNLLFNTTHTILGTVLLGLFLLQPLFGIAHHLQYRKHSQRTPISHVHIWYGRLILFLGVVNGGLGLRLAANSKLGNIVYGAVTAVVALIYIGLAIGWRKGRGRQRVKEQGSEEIRLRNYGGSNERMYRDS